MPNKGIFIGLGGAGVITAARIKEKLLRDVGDDLGKLSEDCRFIFIDTAADHITRINDAYGRQFNGNQLILSNERVDLGDVNALQIYVRARDGANANIASEEERHLFSFVDQKGTKEFKNDRMRDGASANRQQGRIGTWVHAGDIQTKINTAMQVLRNIGEESYNLDPVTIYLISGTCGGTGSSAFLDVAYLIDVKLKELYPTAGDPKLRAVLFMPNYYVQRYRDKQLGRNIEDNYQNNAYAFFNEVKYFLRDRWGDQTDAGTGKRFASVAVDPKSNRNISGANLIWSVFKFAICIDSTTEQGASLTDSQMYGNTAEMLYHWHRGNAQGTMISNFDNVLMQSYAATPQDKPVPAFVTMGYRALQFPAQLMRDYFRRRFLYELFHFGLLGHDYRDALPNDEQRQRELEGIFRQSVQRYMFSPNAEENIPNLENARAEIIESSLATLSVRDFKKDTSGFTDSLLGRFTDRDSFDTDKIADASRLGRLIDTADTISREIERTMADDFASTNSVTGEEKLLNMMRHGAQTDQETARTGSLERHIEDAILRFGLNYAAGLTRLLDTQAGLSIAHLIEEKTRQQATLNQLAADIESARESCLADDRDSQNAFAALYGKLQETVRVRTRIVILNQQLRLLNILSESESGILDDYRRNLEEMKKAVNEKLAGTKDDKDRSVGLTDSYTVELPRRFADTANDVTTTFVPDVKSFVIDDKHWTSDNLFARLYTGLVEQKVRMGGSSEPLRHGEKYGLDPDIQGLHNVLRRMLTSKAITGSDRGYEQNGEIVFFRRFFNGAKPETPQRMVNQMESFADQYISGEIEQSQTVQNEIQRPLLERVKNDLNATERQALKDKFSYAGTQTFCDMRNDAGAASFNSLYVGSDQELAKLLGFEENSSSQRIDGDTPDRFLHIKALTNQTLDRYPHYDGYKQVYATTREERLNPRLGQNQVVFAPHIHRLFNEHGVEVGMRLLDQPPAGDLLNLFAATLLYREVFEIVAKQNVMLLKELIELDPRLTGARKTCVSPILVEDNGTTDSSRVLACERVARNSDKLCLEYGEFVNIAGYARNYKDIHDGIAAHPEVREALKTFDQFFRERCSTAWLSYFNDACTNLEAKLKANPSVTQEMQKFSDDLQNAYVDLSENLRTHIAGKQGGSSSTASTQSAAAPFKP